MVEKHFPSSQPAKKNKYAKKVFVNLKSNLALKSNKGHNLLKIVFPSNNVKLFMFPY